MQIVFQIIWTVIGRFLSVILTKLLIQNGKYIRQNQELIKQNQDMIKKLIELVDIRTEMIIKELKR